MRQAETVHRKAAPVQMPPQVLDQAVAWAVKLHSGTARPEDYEAFAAWRAREPMHEQAWQQIQAVDDELRSIPHGSNRVACRTLAQVCHNRSVTRRGVLRMAVLAAVAGGAGLLLRAAPWQQRAVYASPPGSRRSIVLDDGSRLLITGSTCLDAIFSPRHRVIRLKQGEVYIETGEDAASLMGRRTFRVETAHASLEALGTRFDVRAMADQTRLHVVEGTVAARLAHGRVIFRSGDTALIDMERNLLSRVDHLDHDPMAWTRGTIVAKRMRLDDFAAEFNRHHGAEVRIAGQAADLHISGVFQLDGPDAPERALDAVARTLPVTVSREGTSLVVTQKRPVID